MTDTTEAWPTLAEVRKRHILATLAVCNGSKTQTAKLLGISIKTVYNFLTDLEDQQLKEKINGHDGTDHHTDIGGEG